MPNLLSRSKHEELESNSALQIKNKKERRAKCEEKWSTIEVLLPLALCILQALFLQQPVLLHFTPQFFCYLFFVSSYFNPCNSFCFVFFFGNFIYTEYLYKPQSIQSINSLHVGNTERGDSFPAASFSHFLSFSFLFLGCQTLLLKEEGYWATVLR